MPKVRKSSVVTKPVPQTDWIKDRMRDLALEQKDAEKVFGTYRAMIWRMLSGEREVTPQELLLWATFLRLPLHETFRRFGYKVEAPTVQVIGAVKANGRVAVFAPAQIEKVEAPNDASGNMKALVVDAPQSELQIFDGTHLYYEPSDVVNPAAFAHLSVLEIGDVGAPVVGILHRISARAKKVEIYGGRERFETDQLISAAPVLWQRSA